MPLNSYKGSVQSSQSSLGHVLVCWHPGMECGPGSQHDPLLSAQKGGLSRGDCLSPHLRVDYAESRWGVREKTKAGWECVQE